MKIRFFRKNTRHTCVDHWVWVEGKGLFVKFHSYPDYEKSEYTIKELLADNCPEGSVSEVFLARSV